MQQEPLVRKTILYQWLLLAGVTALAWLVVSRPGPIPVLGHLQDVFLPLNAVAAVEAGMSIHGDVHSPFGYIYFWLHWLAWQLHNKLALESSIITILPLAGLVFTVLPLAALVALRFVLGANVLLRPWLAAFIVALAVSPRNQGEYDHKELLWYGLYNNQLWGLAVVPLAALAALLALPDIRANVRASALRQGVLAAVLAVVLYVAFHFKISFFLTTGAITAGIALTLGPAAGSRIFFGVATLVLMAISVTALFGYDYPGYVENLLHAVRAKQEATADRRSLVAASLASLLVSAVVLAAGVEAREGRRTRENVALAMAPAGLATAGVVLGVMGDYSAAGSWLWLLPAFALLVRPGPIRALRYLAVVFFAVHIALDTLALARTVQLSARHADAQDYEAVEPGDPALRFHVLLESGENAEAEVVEGFRDRVEAWISVAAFAPTLGLQQLPELWNITYARGREEAAEWLKANAAGLVAGEIEFVHGATWLAGEPPPPGPHWFHLGTTMPSSELSRLWDWYNTWDVVLVPVLSPGGHHQTVLACNFFRFNRRNGYPFEIVDVTPHWLYFASRERSETLRNPVLKPWHEYDQGIVQGNCRARAQSIW